MWILVLSRFTVLHVTTCRALIAFYREPLPSSRHTILRQPVARICLSYQEQLVLYQGNKKHDFSIAYKEGSTL